MSKLKPLAMIAAVIAFTATAAGAATAVPTAPEGLSASALAYGQCSGSWVRMSGFASVRVAPDATSKVMFTVDKAVGMPCRKLVVGARYNACGVTGANGWIMVQDGANQYTGLPGWSGYVPSVCTTDLS
ncbi:MAG TPA: hypothetical protein VM677_03585 [Actinokineospora sp.]|jgi:hypothetical protein|nr:hypothetical protein [Actinokineospora sp.]